MADSKTPLIDRLKLRYGHAFTSAEKISLDFSSHPLIQEAIQELADLRHDIERAAQTTSELATENEEFGRQLEIERKAREEAELQSRKWKVKADNSIEMMIEEESMRKSAEARLAAVEAETIERCKQIAAKHGALSNVTEAIRALKESAAGQDGRTVELSERAMASQDSRPDTDPASAAAPSLLLPHRSDLAAAAVTASRSAPDHFADAGKPMDEEAARLDAGRYRHVRLNPEMLLHLKNSEFDAAIDAAMKALK